VQAVIALMAGYGFDLSEDRQNAVILVATVALGFFNWTQNSPADAPGLHEEPMTPPTVVNQTIVSTAGPDVDVPDALVKRAAERSGGY